MSAVVGMHSSLSKFFEKNLKTKSGIKLVKLITEFNTVNLSYAKVVGFCFFHVTIEVTCICDAIITLSQVNIR